MTLISKTFSFALAAILLAHGISSAATISVSASAPTPDADDQYNFTNSPSSSSQTENNVYMYSDRPAQGQTFQTGGNPGGYLLTAFTFRDGGLSSNHPNGQVFDLRVTLPNGGALSVLASETAVLADGSTVPAGTYVTFNLTTPVLLASNTIYGFDGATPGPPAGTGMLVDGTNDVNAYSAGTGYSSGSNGAGNLVFTARDLDRVFLASLVAVPEPSSFALLTLGSLFILRRRVKR